MSHHFRPSRFARTHGSNHIGRRHVPTPHVTKADLESLRTLIPVVRYLLLPPVPRSNEEMYWQTATKLELATAAATGAQPCNIRGICWG